jgi:putative sporulation protein YtaF
MMSWLTVLALALSSSIDNFGVGISYGIRGIRIGFVSNVIISVIAFAFSEAGIYGGDYLAKVLPGTMSSIIGALFLFIVGLRIILLTLPRNRTKPRTPANGITGILSEPEKADFDRSGHIGYLEAVVLGMAVSLNALTNGLGAGLMKISPTAISMSAAVFSFIAIWGGSAIGRKAADVKIGAWSLGQFSTVISGLILLVIALKTIL